MTSKPDSFRLAKGGMIDRSRPISFRFAGRPYQGFAGDTLASALIANGVKLVGRSFKYHRPRGIFGVGAEEANALVQSGAGLGSTPNMRATEILLHRDLVAEPVNCWPSVRFDVGGIIGWLARFFPAGFYYKTFIWPGWWIYEGAIRRAAGLGKVAPGPDPARYERRHAHCDVLVVGSGPAGLAAARAAAQAGARVILAEQDTALGGQLRWGGGVIDGLTGADWIKDSKVLLGDNPDVRILLSTTVTGYFDDNHLTMIEAVSRDDPDAPAYLPRYRQWEVQAKKVILATGAIERPLVFPGNDRPGIMLAAAVRQYIGRYAVRPGNVCVVFTNNDTAYQAALAFVDAGGRVAALVDTRTTTDDMVTQTVTARGIRLFLGSAIVATRGYKALTGVTVVDSEGRQHKIACDLLASSGGSNPTVHLFSQSGGTLAFDASRSHFYPAQSVQAEISVGAAAGHGTLQDALVTGHAAGLKTAPGDQDVSNLHAPCAMVFHPVSKIEPCWSIEGRGKSFVDMQNDVSTADIRLAARENFVSVEHLKRYTTLGMASDQGKTSNVNALAIMAQLTDRSIEATGTTRYRYPFVPTPLGAFAAHERGALLRPRRRLVLHDWHVSRGAIMEDFGWERPVAYVRPGESRQQAERREIGAVRNRAGLFDGSPLGKIEVRGPDAARFLDFIYANAMSTLKVGKVRYGLLLDDRGIILDDGVCARLADDHFLVGASSAGADRIADWLEEWLQCEFPHYDVLVAPVTTSWGVLTLTGPCARAILTDVGVDFPVGAIDFPHMSVRTGRIADLPTRILRVSYTGETSYEINVPTGSMAQLAQYLEVAGVRHGLELVGIDAWNLLRLEKGYLHVGGDTDGTSTPLNVGWGHVMKRKTDFVGKRSLLMPVNRQPELLQLVGLRGDGDGLLPIGAHLVHGTGAERRSDGFVTSSGYSPNLEAGVALAMVYGGTRRLGETVPLQHGGVSFSATLVDAVVYDPEGARLSE